MKKINKKNILHIKNKGIHKKQFFIFFLCLSLLPLFNSCKKKYAPKPYGYFRVYLPEHSYSKFDILNFPYRFDLSNIAKVENQDRDEEKYWINIVYPTLNAKIHGSYKHVGNNMFELSEDTREFVYAHTGQAERISEQFFENPENSVYGILYDLKGNVASPIQFLLTDSTNHFFRGALYFNNSPNKDSIAPILDYVREDIVQMIETFEWKK